MFDFLKIFLFLLFSLFVNTSTYGQSKIVYIDLDFIISNSNVGKKLLQNLKDEESLKINELQEKEKKLKNEENQILGSKNLISEEQLKINIENFQKKLAEYRSYNEIEIKKLKDKRNKEVKNLLNSINSIIEIYMADNSISMIIDKKNIYIAHKNYDITDKLIQLINENIK